MEEHGELDRKNLTEKMAKELPRIRKKLSLSLNDVERATNIGEKRLLAIEQGRQELKWSEYLSLVFVLWLNEGSRLILEEKKLFPEGLKRIMSLNRNAHGMPE